MNLLHSITTIASSSVISQLIGASSIWFITHQYGMAEVGIYALIYSIALVGAQVCTFASQLLIPRQPDDEQLARNVVFCILQISITAVPYALFTAWVFHQSSIFLYLLTLGYGFSLISENISLRTGNYQFLVFQRIMISVIVIISLVLSSHTAMFYWLWTIFMLVLITGCILYSFRLSSLSLAHWGVASNLAFFRENRQYLIKIGGAEVLAMVNNNLPIMLINLWFSALTAGYFSVVMRFCLSPAMIIGNAVRNSIFSKWSMDFRNDVFNYQEYKKIRNLLFLLGVICTLGVMIFYPLVMRLGFSQEWIDSIPSSRYILPYLFPALAVCPLTVVELIFGSQRYFFLIQLQQLGIVLLAFLVVPWLYSDYALAIIIFSILTFLRYLFIWFRMNKRAALLKQQQEARV